MDEQALYERACDRYFRRDKRRDFPAEGATEVRRHRDGTTTVELHNCNGLLARYRYYPKSDRLRLVA